MAVYRYQAVSVGLWRGKIKRWNTTFHMEGSAGIPEIRAIMNRFGYKAPGDVVGACSGGCASVSCYPTTGGAPVAQTVFFDWQTPSTWIPYSSEVWASIPAGTPLDAAGESALVMVGNMASLSKTGKPTFTRKYFHAVPSRQGGTYLDPDVSEAVLTAAAGILLPIYMLNPSGVAPVTVEGEEWYGNHQRVRGRRRTVAQVATNSFSAGVVAGSGAAAGSTAPFPGQ